MQSGLSQELMREQIRLERRIELCFEQLRYFDTRRWLIAEQTEDVYKRQPLGIRR